MLFSSYPGDTRVSNYADQDFDYVICGGGTAGCVLASRLSEDPEVTVLVIEAGESDARQLMSRIPAGWGQLWRTPAEWGFDTVPQAAMGGERPLFYPRGKMLGGCSAINAQISQRCAPSDFDEWEARGAEGWNYAALKPCFHRAEHFTSNPDYQIDLSERGSSGHWKTSYPPTSEVGKAFLQSTIAAGLPFSPDLNVERHAMGVSRFQANVDSGGTRSSTAAAYLSPSVISGRRNLSILTATMCTRLHLDAETELATGVEVGQAADGQRWVVRARKEVLVCQGAIGSPQLLLASGLGPKEDLQKVGIKCLRDMPAVGANLVDHVFSMFSWQVKPGSSLEYIKDPIKSLPALARWMWDGKGPLSNNMGEVGGFLRSDNIPGCVSSIKSEDCTASGPDAPDLEVICTPCYFQNHATEVPLVGAGQDQMTIGSVVLRPVSTGSIKITSDNTFDKPLIDPNFYGDENGHDLQVQLEGMKLILRIARLEPFKSMIVQRSCPVELDEEELSDEALKAHILAKSETIYHPTSSCRMGPEKDNNVVDSSLKVYGFKNLRVVDASIFPSIVSGHPCSAVVATAERASDLIKGLV